MLTTTNSDSTARPMPGMLPPRHRLGNASLAVVIVLILAAATLLVAAPLAREVVGLLVIALLILLMLAGLPVAFAMLLSGLLGLTRLGGLHVIDATFEENIYTATASWQLSVLPLFILMGIAMWRSGLTDGAFEAARQWVGKLPGGLAIGTNFAGAGLAAASGSTMGISYALGRIAIPEMLRAGYAPSIATGVVAMAGTLGQLIPPSVILVIYAGIAETPVGPQLLAAIIPALIVAAGYAVMLFVRAVVNSRTMPRAEIIDVTWRSRYASLLGLVPIVVIIVVVIGGMFSGVFTPTEAGAFGALTAILAGWLLTGKVSRRPRAFLAFLKKSLLDTVVATSAIFLLLIGVEVLTRVMTLSRFANGLADMVVGLGLDRVSFLLILIPAFLVLGMFMDTMAMMLITFPVLAAPLAALDVDLLWFGVFIVMLAEIALVTPPIGILSFVVHRLAQLREVNVGHTVTLIDVFKGVSWFIVVSLVVLVLMIFFPELATWLPGLSATG